MKKLSKSAEVYSKLIRQRAPRAKVSAFVLGSLTTIFCFVNGLSFASAIIGLLVAIFGGYVHLTLIHAAALKEAYNDDIDAFKRDAETAFEMRQERLNAPKKDPEAEVQIFLERVNQFPAVEQILETGDKIASYQDKEIFEWIKLRQIIFKLDGTCDDRVETFEYDGIIETETLKLEEAMDQNTFVMSPGIVYKKKS